MAINKNKAMEAAQKFVEKGQLDKAIKEYAKIVEEDPKDVRVWLKLGDLYAKKGAKPEATETYLRVAQFYSDQGFYLKAVAVYKQVLKLDPRLIEVNIKLAEVYRQLGLLSDAMQQYELVAAFYHREGKTREALSTIRELVELDPDNVATRIKLAELYSKEQMTKEAVAEFAKAAEYLRTHGRLDDFIKVAERLVWHQPDNHPMNRELAGLYLKRNDPRHALQKLQACFKADARDVETLALLAAAFLALDQKPKTVSVWKELARVLTENHQTAQAVEVHRRILSLVPDDAEALAAVGGRQATGTGTARAIASAGNIGPMPSLQSQPVRVSGQMPAVGLPAGSEPGERPSGPRVSMPMRGVGSMEAAPLVSLKQPTRQVEPVIGGGRGEAPVAARGATPMPPAFHDPSEPDVEHDDDAVAIEVDEASDQTAQNRRGDATVEATIDADFELPDARTGERDEKVAKLLAEADVYIKYSIRDRAIAHLGKVLELDPDNVEAHERLKDLYLGQNRRAEASLHLVRLIELVAVAGAEQAEPYLAELATLDPEAASAIGSRLGRPSVVEDSGSAPAVSLDSVDVMIEPPSVQTLAVEPGSGDEGTDVRDEFPQLATDGTAPGEGTIDVGELEVGDDQVESEEDSHPDLAFEDNASTAGGAEQTYDISMEAAPVVDAGRSLDDLDGLGGEAELPAQEYAIDPGDDAIEESIGVELEPEDDGSKAAGSLEDDLDEADFFVTQGLIEEARTILLDLLRRHPNHPLVGAKLKDLEGREGIHVPPTEPPGPRTAAVSARATSSAGATASMPDAPRRVIAKPLGGTDADTHYDLGLAYKEMGLLEEAIKEFELVRESPGRAVQCHLMIGLCHVQRGKLQEAVDEFKSGLYVEGITDREALALYFELGAAYEGLGDEREALYYYEKVLKRDPRFRDIGRRIESLQGADHSGGNGARATSRADGSGDEEMNAIDSLLGENEV